MKKIFLYIYSYVLFSGREKIGSSEHPEIYSSLHASDGFFINLTAVLLLLCKPFAEPCSSKLFKVDPLYVASPLSTDTNRNGVHIKSKYFIVKIFCVCGMLNFFFFFTLIKKK